MKNKLDTDLKGSARAACYSEGCADAVQSNRSWKICNGAGEQFRSWIERKLKAHENRVHELNIYRRNRVDDAQTVHNKTSAGASK